MQLANILIILIPLPFLFLVFWVLTRDFDKLNPSRELAHYNIMYKPMFYLNVYMLVMLLAHLGYFIWTIPDLLQ